MTKYVNEYPDEVTSSLLCKDLLLNGSMQNYTFNSLICNNSVCVLTSITKIQNHCTHPLRHFTIRIKSTGNNTFDDKDFVVERTNFNTPNYEYTFVIDNLSDFNLTTGTFSLGAIIEYVNNPSLVNNSTKFQSNRCNSSVSKTIADNSYNVLLKFDSCQEGYTSSFGDWIQTYLLFGEFRYFNLMTSDYTKLVMSKYSTNQCRLYLNNELYSTPAYYQEETWYFGIGQPAIFDTNIKTQLYIQGVPIGPVYKLYYNYSVIDNMLNDIDGNVYSIPVNSKLVYGKIINNTNNLDINVLYNNETITTKDIFTFYNAPNVTSNLELKKPNNELIHLYNVNSG